MSIANFLNPVEESAVIENKGLNPDDLLKQIITNYMELLGDDKDDNSAPILPALILTEALQALKVVIAYSEQQKDLELSTIHTLEQYKRQLERKASNQVV